MEGAVGNKRGKLKQKVASGEWMVKLECVIWNGKGVRKTATDLNYELS